MDDQIQTKTTGKGAKGKTEILNLEHIALRLRVPRRAILKWFEYEKDCKWDHDNVITGKHNRDQLKKCLDQ